MAKKKKAKETDSGTLGRLSKAGEEAFTRLVEELVKNERVTDALGKPTMATPDGIALTASILDELLARRTVGRRPADLSDDVAWVRAASGRSEHPDPRLPLIG